MVIERGQPGPSLTRGLFHKIEQEREDLLARLFLDCGFWGFSSEGRGEAVKQEDYYSSSDVQRRLNLPSGFDAEQIKATINQGVT
jgi:hypothetical protein